MTIKVIPFFLNFLLKIILPLQSHLLWPIPGHFKISDQSVAVWISLRFVDGSLFPYLYTALMIRFLELFIFTHQRTRNKR
jgi:hypothetical protein